MWNTEDGVNDRRYIIGFNSNHSECYVVDEYSTNNIIVYNTNTLRGIVGHLVVTFIN